MRVLVLNPGSSTLKASLVDGGTRIADAQVGWPAGEENAAGVVAGLLGQLPPGADSVGYRVVHGGPDYRAPARVDERLLARVEELDELAPLHNRRAAAVMRAGLAALPGRPHVACFDTAFHRDMPRIARIVPLPRRYEANGVQRYGFHGLSYAYLMEELARQAGPAVARGRVVLAHLGNGASLAAVRDGRSIDTSMGFTPAAGVPMSTRSGDLDPGLVLFLAQAEGMTAARFHDMVNRESGLLGVSQTSSDVRDLLAREAGDVRAAEALALFCYQVKKWIGAFAAALGGLETLVFAGGIGENAPALRARICEGLAFLGVEIDGARNAAGGPVVSSDASRATVRVIRTDEEVMIAKAVRVLEDSTAGRDIAPGNMT